MLLGSPDHHAPPRKKVIVDQRAIIIRVAIFRLQGEWHSSSYSIYSDYWRPNSFPSLEVRLLLVLPTDDPCKDAAALLGGEVFALSSDDDF